MSAATPLFERDGEGFVPTVYARGPWDPGLLHGGAVGALAAEVLQSRIDGAYQPVRLTVDLVRPVPMRTLDTVVEIIRTGARLASARVAIVDRDEDKTAAVATMLALRPAPLEGHEAQERVAPPDAPSDGEDRWGLSDDDEAFLGGALTFRFVVPDEPDGAGGGAPASLPAMWLRLHREVLAGLPPSPLARVAAAADVPSAVSTFDGRRYDGVGFINADLSLHLHRPLEGAWVRMAAVSRWEQSGIGTVAATLADASGAVGRVSQGLILATGLTPPPPV